MNKEKIIEELNKGNLVIVPTDTVYGILADATNIEAVKKVYKAKKRDINKPLILIVDSYKMLCEYTKNITQLEKQIIDKFLPGKLTILLEKNEKVEDIVTGGSNLVGIRIPDNQELLDIIKIFGKSLIATSANISDKRTIVKVEDIENELLQHIAYVEDGGVLSDTPSTLIKVENEKIHILREGSICTQLMQAFPDKEG